MRLRALGIFTVALVPCLALLAGCGSKGSVESFGIEGPIAGTEFEQASSPGITISPDGEYVVFLLEPNQDDALGTELISLARSSGEVRKARVGDCVTSPQALEWPYAWFSNDQLLLVMRDDTRWLIHIPTFARERRFSNDRDSLMGPAGVRRGELEELAHEGGHSNLTSKVTYVRTDRGLVTYFPGTAGMKTGTGKSKTVQRSTIYRRSPGGELAVVTRFRHLFYEATCTSLSVSPDDRYLIYEWCVGVKRNPLQFGCRAPKYILNLVDGERKKLNELAGTANIVWTPDSKEAYFVVGQTGAGGLYVVLQK